MKNNNHQNITARKIKINYEPDIDNVIEILKNSHGYGDLGWSYFEEFEHKTFLKEILSDKEYADKIDDHLKSIG